MLAPGLEDAFDTFVTPLQINVASPRPALAGTALWSTKLITDYWSLVALTAERGHRFPDFLMCQRSTGVHRGHIKMLL